MSKVWKEIPELFLSWTLRIGLGVFYLLAVINAGILAIYSRSWGMVEGMAIGAGAVLIYFMFLDRKVRVRMQRVNGKVKELIREAEDCEVLAEQFGRDGQQSLKQQFTEDAQRKYRQCLGLLGGTLKPEDIRTEGR